MRKQVTSERGPDCHSQRLHMGRHFREVSSRYRKVRTFDIEPLVEIYIALPPRNKKFRGFDLGCGTGRYSLEFLIMLLNREPTLKIDFVLIDASKHMLAVARQSADGITANISFVCGKEDALKSHGNFFDFGMTTNAIHHFDIPLFLAYVRTALKLGGRLFVYTRTQEQNRRIIWGTHFPEFAARETRLLVDGQMEDIIDKVDGLRIAQTASFRFDRKSSLARLLDQARSKHYSTFRFYSDRDFENAIAKFESAIRSDFSDVSNVDHADENILYVIERT